MVKFAVTAASLFHFEKAWDDAVTPMVKSGEAILNFWSAEDLPISGDLVWAVTITASSFSALGFIQIGCIRPESTASFRISKEAWLSVLVAAVSGEAVARGSLVLSGIKVLQPWEQEVVAAVSAGEICSRRGGKNHGGHETPSVKALLEVVVVRDSTRELSVLVDLEDDLSPTRPFESSAKPSLELRKVSWGSAWIFSLERMYSSSRVVAT